MAGEACSHQNGWFAHSETPDPQTCFLVNWSRLLWYLHHQDIRRQEKHWGIIFKCLTTQCVHLVLLPSLDSDAFHMAVRRFVSHWGTPFEIWSDHDTNFRGGARELEEVFSIMTPILQGQLAKQRITFHYNPPHAPHFGRAWEREIRSVKAAFQVILKDQSVTEEVLRTALIEV